MQKCILLKSMCACSLFSSPSLFTLFFSHTCACKHPQVYSHTHTVVSHLQSSSCRAVAKVATAGTPHTHSRPNETCPMCCACSFVSLTPLFPHFLTWGAGGKCARFPALWSLSFSPPSRSPSHAWPRTAAGQGLSCWNRGMRVRYICRKQQRHNNYYIAFFIWNNIVCVETFHMLIFQI